MYINILGFNIFSKSKKDLLKEVYSRKGKVNIISGNPEVLYTGYHHKVLLDSFTRSSTIIIPDGVGVILASKLLKKPITEKIAGIEVMEELIKNSEITSSLYFLGAKKETLLKCVENLKTKYPYINVAGYRDGYFDVENCEEIINEINRSRAEVLFVAMGCPRQELFITNNMDKINCKIFMGVGGSFDVISGNINRAPKWMIKLGLEWLYRVAKEPWRVKRLTVIPKFIIKALVYNKDKDVNYESKEIN